MKKLITMTIAAALIANVGAADAAFNPAELQCRAAIAKTAGKLSGAVGKAVTGCHKSRDLGKIDAGTNCEVLPTADTKGLVAKAEGALAAAVGGAKDACPGIVPADIGYDACPAPCAGAIATMSDVADCVTCLVEETAVTAYAEGLGTSTLPLGGIEAKCRGAIGKSMSKQISTILKERIKCQGAAEAGGDETTASCATFDDGAINSTRDKGEAAVLKACSPADQTAIASCDDASISGLQDCTIGSAGDAGDESFLYIYGDEPVPPLTWTEIQALLSTSCAGCHTGGGSSGGLSGLDNYATGYGELVNAATSCGSADLTTRVVPGDADASFFMAKLDGTQDCGVRMPIGGPFLDATVRAGIRAWIDSGAPMD
jgi:hypothetical protein